MNAEARVLVVDDEEIVCDSCARILTDEGFSVETSIHPGRGLEMARERDYTAVLLDIKMSEMDGLEFLERLRETKPNVPVIVITGYPDTYGAAECMRLGATDYLPKPFTPSEITGSVRRAASLPQPVIERPLPLPAEDALRVERAVVAEAPPIVEPAAKRKTIACRIDHCLACKSCEIACALEHSQSGSLTKAVSERPRPQRRVTVEAAGAHGLPLQCRHCEEGPCQSVCPTGAIHRDQQSGLTLVDEDLCIGCKLCILVCPLGVLQIGERNRATIKCDQCLDRQKEGLEPACVAACPTHALQLVDEGEISKEDRRLVAVTIEAPVSEGDETVAQVARKTVPPRVGRIPGARRRRVVVVGSNAAGAMAAIRAAEAGAKVTLITADRVSYRRPAIPALIAGYLEDIGEAPIFAPKTLRKHGVEVVLRGKAVDLDPKKKTIAVRTSDGEMQEVLFDAAVLATGGIAARPKIPGADKQGVCTFTTAEGAREILQYAEGARAAVVVGASFVALEVAQALLERGLTVYFNVRSRILRRLVEPDVSEFLQKRFAQSGLRMLTGEAISEIGGADRVEYVVHRGEEIPVQLVVLGTGVRPNVGLGEAAQIKLAESGAIAVDSRMQTSAPDIYAAGDCAEVPDFSTGRFVYSPVGSTGALAGAVAGANAAGGNQRTDGLLRAQADHILGFQIYSIGHTTTTAENVGLAIEVEGLPTPPEVERLQDEVLGKLLTDAEGRIVGAQAVARRHGSQYGWQLYRAVLLKEPVEAFLRSWMATRCHTAQMAARAEWGKLVVPPVGKQE